MAANTRTHAAPGFADGEILTHTQITAIDVMAAASVRRSSTVSAWRNVPLAYMGSSDTAGLEHSIYTINGVTYLRNTTFDVAFALSLPHGHQIDKLRLDMLPAGAHGGQPGSLPGLKLWKVSLVGAATSLGSLAYVWVDVGTYEGGIRIDITGLAETIDNFNYRYIAQINPESGVNSVTGTTLQNVSAYVIIDSAEGGADLKFWP